jgi:hypothetical protein
MTMRKCNAEMNLNQRRRKRSAMSTLPLVCFLSFASAMCADAFQPTDLIRRGRMYITRNVLSKPDSTARNADQKDKETVSWSKSGRTSSPFQVRKRVKAVLEKARSRTGIKNTSKASSIVAEAASLGGLGDGSDDFVLQLNELMSWQKETNVEGQEKPNDEVRSGDLDSINADMPAAAQFSEPLPFKLPKLSKAQINLLQAGERIQEQARMGREGSGYVVVDVKAPPYVVWECLLDFESYPETIPTVRDMQLFTNQKLNTGYVNEKPVLPGTGRETRHYGTPSVTRAAFVLSKFRLDIAAIHKYTPHPEGDYMIFTLDPSCTNMVLKGAKGTWYTEESPEGREVRKRHLVLEYWK